MAKPEKDQYSDSEAKQRFERLVKAALNTPPKPLKSVPRKRVETLKQENADEGPIGAFEMVVNRRLCGFGGSASLPYLILVQGGVIRLILEIASQLPRLFSRDYVMKPAKAGIANMEKRISN